MNRGLWANGTLMSQILDIDKYYPFLLTSVYMAWMQPKALTGIKSLITLSQFTQTLPGKQHLI